jgi:UDP-3-O-[3-hydroxymyristoyl] glucosamine N-acyltransferase
VKSGDIGGWIESEDNLSHKGHAWVADESKVYGLGKVYEDGHAMDNAEIYGVASISGTAIVCDNAKIHGAVKVYGSAIIGDNHDLKENLHIIKKGRMK